MHMLKKLGILGISEAAAREGLKHNIRVNTIAPVASTGSLAVALSNTNGKNKTPLFKPEYIVPVILLLSSDTFNGTPNRNTGGLYEVGCGWHAATQLRVSSQIMLTENTPFTTEELSKWWGNAGNPKPQVLTSKGNHDIGVLETIES